MQILSSILMQIPRSLLTHVDFNKIIKKINTQKHPITEQFPRSSKSELFKTKLSSAIHQIRSEPNRCKYPRNQMPIAKPFSNNIPTTHGNKLLLRIAFFLPAKSQLQNNESAQWWALLPHASPALLSLTNWRCVYLRFYWSREAVGRWRWCLVCGGKGILCKRPTEWFGRSIDTGNNVLSWVVIGWLLLNKGETS